MSEQTDFWLKFWGVRGSIACPGEDTIRYGGNTSCIEVHCGDYNLIFDMGTGLKQLGDALPPGKQLNYDIFLTHSHMDHVNGFPFFKPAYSPATRLKLWAGHLRAQGLSLEQIIRNLMDQPFFPITVDLLAASLVFNDFSSGDDIRISDDIVIQTTPLNHPGGGTGYRLNYAGRSLCYITDTEHVPGKPDKNILALIEGADMVIYDSNFTDAEFGNHVGWGHSTWQEGARLCEMANVKTFVAFHHDPSHTDTHMDSIAQDLEAMRPNSIVAKEGMVLYL
ncbi:MAG: MBL fold metallo-hydrolase [Alphaproteobacteria bacterium]|nr:MBL fold metallo-hydrolase [Alphaproteobacteria bacterium]